MQGVLYVASAGDVQLADDVQGGSTQHLIFFIAKGLGRCYDDTVSGVHADRVDVFHVADGDAVAGTIPHDFVLDLFPAGDAAFYQNLSYSGQTQTIFEDFYEFFVVMGDSAAASAEGVCRTQYYRVSDDLGKFYTVFYVFYDTGMLRSAHRSFPWSV